MTARLSGRQRIPVECGVTVFVNASAPQGWQCPSCRRVYAPSVAMCFSCPAEPAASTGTSADPYACICDGVTMQQCPAHPFGQQDTVDFIAKGHLGTPCPRPREGGMCGCDEPGDEAPKVCLSSECDC